MVDLIARHAGGADETDHDARASDRPEVRGGRYADEIRNPDRALRLVLQAGASEASQADDRVHELVDSVGPRALPLLVRLAPR